ncbi:MAG: ABC transporter permease [Pseudomonadota bacterium]
MLRYVLRRVAYVVPIALGVSIVCFALVHLVPGEIVDAIVPADAPPEVVEQMTKDYGFDQPLPVQYGLWLWRAVQGDLGESLVSGRPVAAEISKAFGNTFVLALAAALLGFSLGLLMGGIAGYLQGSLWDRLVTGLAVTGVSLPHYWLGIVLVIIFSAQLNWLPAVGAGPAGSDQWQLDWAHLRHMILPAVTLAAIPLGIIARTVRAVVAEILNQEYVETLRAKGLGEGRILVHVIKNAAPTVLAVMGLQFGYLLGGSILVETVFSWPGTGFLMNTAILQRDLPLLQGTILVLALFFVSLNFAVDILQTLLDPRIRRG